MSMVEVVRGGFVDAFGLSEAELALCCASHQGEREHVDAARSILRKAGADESLLRCGTHASYAPSAARALVASGVPPEPIMVGGTGRS